MRTALASGARGSSISAPELLEGPPPSPEAAEPEGGGKEARKKLREARRGKECLDCGAIIETPFCPQCGQENIDVNTSVLEIFREAAQEFFFVDSKLVRTLIPLLFKPGTLTREWRLGRRTRYISPLKLYLTVTAIFFIALPLISKLNVKTSAPGKSKPSVTKPVVVNEEKKDAAEEDSSPDQVAEDIEELPDLLQYPAEQLNKLNQLTEADEKQREEHVKELGDMFLDNIPTAIFLMLPFFSGVLWLLYVRNKRFYVEHLVFALHCHAFYFVLFTLIVLIPGHWLFGLSPLITIVALPLYSLIALKVNYGQGWIKTLIKAWMLGVAYFFLLGIAMLGSLIVAASALPERDELKKIKSEAKPAVSTTKKASPPSGK